MDDPRVAICSGSEVADSIYIHSLTLLNLSCCINSTFRLLLVIPTRLIALINLSLVAHLCHIFERINICASLFIELNIFTFSNADFALFHNF